MSANTSRLTDLHPKCATISTDPPHTPNTEPHPDKKVHRQAHTYVSGEHTEKPRGLQVCPHRRVQTSTKCPNDTQESPASTGTNRVSG